MDDVVTAKRAMRAQMRALLGRFARAEFEAAGERVADALSPLLHGTVAAFASMRWEIETAPLLAVARAHGARILLPVTMQGDPALCDSAGDVAPAASCDVVVVPGAAFDMHGGRLGWGRGFYDRLLVDVLRTRIVALCMDAQIVPGVAREPHDVQVGWLCTPERGLIATS